MGPCIIERNQDLLLDEIENTHSPQQTLGLLDGAVTSEEANQHHQSSDGYQYVDTCRHTVGEGTLVKDDSGCVASSAPLGGSTV